MGERKDYNYLLNTYQGRYYILNIIYGNEHEKKLSAQKDTERRFNEDSEALSSKQHESFYRGIREPRIGQFKPYDDNRPWVLVKCDCGSPAYWCRLDNNITNKHGQSCPLCINRKQIFEDTWRLATPGQPVNYKRIDNLTGETFGELFVLDVNEEKSKAKRRRHTWYHVIDSSGEIATKRGCELRKINS